MAWVLVDVSIDELPRPRRRVVPYDADDGLYRKRDTGCHLSPHCLTCVLPRCVEDETVVNCPESPCRDFGGAETPSRPHGRPARQRVAASGRFPDAGDGGGLAR